MDNKKLILYCKYISLLNLKARDYKIFLFILNELKPEEYTIINQTILSESLNMSKAEISKGIKTLVDKNILVLNPNSKYKSKKKELKLNNYTDEGLEGMIFNLLRWNLYG